MWNEYAPSPKNMPKTIMTGNFQWSGGVKRVINFFIEKNFPEK
jgi:hypothetical protein